MGDEVNTETFKEKTLDFYRDFSEAERASVLRGIEDIKAGRVRRFNMERLKASRNEGDFEMKEFFCPDCGNAHDSSIYCSETIKG